MGIALQFLDVDVHRLQVDATRAETEVEEAVTSSVAMRVFLSMLLGRVLVAPGTRADHDRLSLQPVAG